MFCFFLSALVFNTVECTRIFSGDLCWVLVAVQAFSSCSGQGLLSHCSAQAPHRTVLTCHEAKALGPRVSFVVLRLSCTEAYGILVPGPGIEPMSSALAGRFLTTGPPGKSLES